MGKILSVSIAAYNVSKYIEKALDSLICDNATLEKIEVLIVSDGSTDNTKQIAEQYCAKYPNSFFLIDKENGGYGSTINAALKRAKGKYFRLLDGDDWYITDNLAGYIHFLEKAEVDIVAAPYIEFYEIEGRQVVVDKHSVIDSAKPLDLTTSNEPDFKELKMHEIAVKTSVLQKNNASITEKCFFTDTEFVFESVLFSKSVLKYDNPIYVYRIGRGGQSVSLEGRRKHWRDAETVLNKILELYGDCDAGAKNTKQFLLRKIIVDNATFQFLTYLVLDCCRENFGQLKRYDSGIKKKCRFAYKAMFFESKVVALLRLSLYTTYRIARRIFIKRHYYA